VYYSCAEYAEPPSYHDLTIFNMAALRQLKFARKWILTMSIVLDDPVYRYTKFVADERKRGKGRTSMKHLM